MERVSRSLAAQVNPPACGSVAISPQKSEILALDGLLDESTNEPRRTDTEITMCSIAAG
jgi:hypothetical protein